MTWSASFEPPLAPTGRSGASDFGRPRPKKKRMRRADVAAQTSPAAIIAKPAISGPATRRSAFSCIAVRAQKRAITPPTISTAAHSQSRRFCNWYGLGNSRTLDSEL